MHASSVFFTAVSAALGVVGSPVDVNARQTSNYAGYLISTFSDARPQVQQYLSNGNSASSFTFLNDGQPILASTVGTKGVRDIFLTTDDDRSRYYLIATGRLSKIHCPEGSIGSELICPSDLDINADGFSWDRATRTGSRGIVVWSSTNLVDWSEPSLKT